MRRFIYGHPQLLLPWAAQRMPWPDFKFPDTSNAMAVVIDDKIACVAVFHDWYPAFKTISMSIAADDARWAGKEAFGTILGFPFLQLGCHSITTWQPASHAKAYKLVKGVGFKDAGLLREKFNGEDIRVLDLLKREAERWLKHCPLGLYGEQETTNGKTVSSSST